MTTPDANEETGAVHPVQEAPDEGQEDAPRRRRRTLSGKLVPSPASFDPWHALTTALDLDARRERRRLRVEAERAERAMAAGLNPAAGLPKVACLKSGCRLPWDEHLTAAGKLRAVHAKAGGHRSASDVPARKMSREERRAMVRSRTDRSRPGRRLASAAFYTHTIFVDPRGVKHRVANQDLDAFVLRHARGNA